MAKFDTYHGNKPLVAFKTYTFTGDEAKVGEIIDSLGYESLYYVLVSGTLTTGTYTPSIAHSDDSGMAGATAVPTEYLLGSYADASFADTDDDAVKNIGTVAKKRYQQMTITGASTAAGTITVAVILSNALHQPTQGSNSPTG